MAQVHFPFKFDCCKYTVCFVCVVAGNGKRSDPGAVLADGDEGRRRLSLQKILASNSLGAGRPWEGVEDDEGADRDVQEELREGDLSDMDPEDLLLAEQEENRQERARELWRKLVRLYYI